MLINNRLIIICLAGLILAGRTPQSPKPIRLITLDPGHFHAALVQKSMYPDVDSTVYVYAPSGPDVQSHLDKIKAYNSRAADPTHWTEQVYSGPDYLQRMIADRSGNTVVLAGNNRQKTTYILQSLQAGFHVLGDKPMVIDDGAFDQLKQAFDSAKAHDRVLYDIMTERYEITSILQRELARLPAVFGTQEKGSPGHPAVVATSIHRWFKYVSGSPLTRPAWFFDTDQQGEGIVDVMTHIVDLVQWGCFPDQTIDYKKDITVDRGRHWTTDLTLSQFTAITNLDTFPAFLKKDLRNDTVLQVYANGEIDYRLRGVYVKTVAAWTCKAPAGADDTYASMMRGSKASLVIRQDTAQQYHSTLYIEPVNADASYAAAVSTAFRPLQAKYPGITLQKTPKGWAVLIPDQYKEGHEAHFARVMEKFLGYVKQKDMPAWEIPGMIAKYYTTTRGLALTRDPDTLTAGVFRIPASASPQGSPMVHGATRDLSRLRVSVYTLSPGQSYSKSDTGDHLLILKQGSLAVDIDTIHKTLGPGGIGLFASGQQADLRNTGSTNTVFYLFSFRSRRRAGPDLTQTVDPPVVLDWPDLIRKKTDKGESRQIFSRPVSWLSKIDMHATTLDPGQISHPQHVHRAEEIILLRSGHVRMHIADGYRSASAGDLVFLPSGVPHDLENGPGGRAEYFALQWMP